MQKERKFVEELYLNSVSCFCYNSLNKNSFCVFSI